MPFVGIGFGAPCLGKALRGRDATWVHRPYGVCHGEAVSFAWIKPRFRQHGVERQLASVRSASMATVVLTLILVMGGEVAWFRARQTPPPTAPREAEAGPRTPAGQAAGPRQSDPGQPDPAKADLARAEPPKFDVVRVEPNGDTVVAGQGAPDAAVDLLVAGTVVARVKTDASGHFAMLPPALTPGNTALTLQQTRNGVTTSSTQSIAVAVPEKNKGGVVVALAEPGQPTKVLAAPTAPGAAPAHGGDASVGPAHGSGASAAPAHPLDPGGGAMPAPGSRVVATASGSGPLVIRSVELENGNGFFASGEAGPGTRVRVYLNDSQIASVIAGRDRGWSVKIVKGLAGGHYSVRADAMGDGTRVTSRVEVPFDVPVAMAASSAPPISPAPAVPRETADLVPGLPVPTAPADAAGGSRPNAAIVAEIKTTIVATGDNLWDISRVRLGEGRRYTRIYAANLRQIRDPKLIYPGQILVMPTGED